MNSLKITGLIGYPLSHSFSQDYFTNKFKREGIQDYSYQNFEIDSIEKIKDIIEKYNNLIGLNVTIPYKQSVIPFLDRLSEQAEEIGAVNTIIIDRRKNSPKLIGHNTDVIGFSKSLDQLTDSKPTGALVLGTGGAAKAVLYVLKKNDIKYLQISRNPVNKEKSYDFINTDLIKDYPLIINTTPLGMFPDINSKPKIPYEFLGRDNYLFDLIYNPPQTPFLELGSKAGAKTINGLPMLIAQAEAAWELWTQKNL